MEEVESRFLHLLQPIRDLTKNWEVDVAAQLGEYLEEVRGVPVSPGLGRLGVTPSCQCSRLLPLLELPANPAGDSAFHFLPCVSQLDQICISFDNGKTTMNFVEAALLIQGSACIYSRKVRSWRPQACPGPGST